MRTIEEKMEKILVEWEDFYNNVVVKNNGDSKAYNNELGLLKNKINNLEAYINSPQNEFQASENSSMKKYLRTGEVLEVKSFTSEKDESGGVFIVPEMQKKLQSIIHKNSVMRKLCSVETISTNTLDIIIEEEKFAYGWVTESAQRVETTGAKLTKKRINVHELYAQPKASQRLLDDAEINIDAWIVERLSDIFSEAENIAFIHGDGEGKPKGILTYPTKDITQIPAIKKQDISPDDLLNIINSLGDAYLKNATFLMSRLTLAKIQKIKDTLGRFIWQPSIASAAPETLFGFPIFTCAEIPTVGEDKPCVILADFHSGYKIVDRKQISIVRDPYTEKPFVKFYATKRVGGDVINPNAIKVLKS